jgi:hypothetical protein
MVHGLGEVDRLGMRVGHGRPLMALRSVCAAAWLPIQRPAMILRF